MPRSWPIIFGIMLILACATTLKAITNFSSQLDMKPGGNGLGVGQILLERSRRLWIDQLKKPGFKIVYLGDSTVIPFDGAISMPSLLKDALDDYFEDWQGVRVYDFSFAGMGPAGFYFLADQIAELKPDLIVWQTSFTHLSPRWQNPSRLGLAGFVQSSRFPELLQLPIAKIGLTTDQLFLNRGIIAFGGLDTWIEIRNEQSRVGQLIPTLNDWIDENSKVPTLRNFKRAALFYSLKNEYISVNGYQRYRRDLELEHYGDSITGLSSNHAILRFFRAGIRHFRSFDIPIFVYMNPINIDNLRSEGIYDPIVMKQSAMTYGAAIESEGASFYDYHDRFSGAYFRDAPGHFIHDDTIHGPQELIDLMAPAIIAQVDRIRGR